jgi:hypothetical protein
MDFTSLHRATGVGPQPLTDELLDRAVEVGAVEMHDLDWKSQLPAMKALALSDFPKDVAAMANNGGGLIIFGVEEMQKAATNRTDVGAFDEGCERALRSAAITAITPPVFGLAIYRLGSESAQNRAVIVEIAASVDGPHLIYRNEFFGAPIRNDSDTVWMKERQVEAMYRARFEERRHASDALDTLYKDAVAGRNTGTRAWLIAVAHPRVPKFLERMDRDAARRTLQTAETTGQSYAVQSTIHPLGNVDVLNPRPGLRRWVAASSATGERQLWREAWASIHHDGSVTLAAAVGGHRMSMDGYFEGYEVEGRAVECAVADLMALTRETAQETGNDEYDVRVGIEWGGTDPLKILTVDGSGYPYEGISTPLHRFAPVETTVDARESDDDFRRHVYELARDCVNQGGISNLHIISPPD